MTLRLLTIPTLMFLLLPSPISSQTILDTFTDTGGTNITAHTPDTGGSWSSDAGTCAIIGGNTAGITALGGGNLYTNGGHVIDSGLSDDYTLSVKLKLRASGTVDAGLIIRHTDSNNYLFIRHRGGSFNTFYIYKVESGSGSVLDSDTYSQTSDDVFGTIDAVVSGDDITATITDGENEANTVTIMATSSFNSTATEVGLWSGTAANSAFDDFTLIGPSTGSGNDAVRRRGLRRTN